MVRGQVSRLIFIDSSVNTHGDRTKVLLPPRSFSASGNEQMSLTLQSFSIRRGWYNINPTNNTGFVYINAFDTHYEFSISPAAYSTLNDLATAVAAALTACIAANTPLNAVVSAASCSYSATTRLFTITFTKQAAHHDKVVEIRCFAIKDVAIRSLTQNGGFNDLFEILRGRVYTDV